MKTIITTLLTGTALWAGNLFGGVVASESVSADAKWLVHLNLDSFRSSDIGAMLFENVIKPQAGENVMGLQIKTDEIYEGIHALTAYGMSFNKELDSIGVLLIKTEARLRAILEATLIQQEAAGGEDTQVRTIQTDPYMIYSIMGDQVYAAILPDETLVISKSLDQLATAVDVIENRAPGLDDQPNEVSRLSQTTDSFFLLATAEGFNESSMIPPQARVLQLAEAARLALGEAGDDLSLDLILQARDETTRTQLQKIVEGLLALASLTRMDNQDFAEVVMNTTVQNKGNDVNVNVHYPVERILAMAQSFGHLAQAEHDELAKHEHSGSDDQPEPPEAPTAP